MKLKIEDKRCQNNKEKFNFHLKLNMCHVGNGERLLLKYAYRMQQICKETKGTIRYVKYFYDSLVYSFTVRVKKGKLNQ